MLLGVSKAPRRFGLVVSIGSVATMVPNTPSAALASCKAAM